MALTLSQLVDSKIRKAKITPADAREVLAVVEKDSKYDKAEVTQLRRLTALPASKFQKKDEFIPNPSDADDGVTVTADPRKWLKGAVELATAKLTVRSTIPEVSIALSDVKEYDVEDFGTHLARSLDVTVKGRNAAQAGTIAFSYGSKKIEVLVKKGESMFSINEKIEAKLLKAQGGSLSINGFISANRTAPQTVKYEVL